ncbi:MAG: hypothetical protein K2G35_10300 [Duncaniella sp.]|nr:hypothetical protein [Duncaniella sp.]
MKKSLIYVLLTAALTVGFASTMEAKVERRWASTPVATDGGESFSVDSIDFRKDLTRVYGRLTGRPHTSGRIDTVEMENRGRKLVADDIDGVDFNRYYQYEDEGVILLEIDFPAMKPAEGAVLIFTGPQFTHTTRISRRK